MRIVEVAAIVLAAILPTLMVLGAVTVLPAGEDANVIEITTGENVVENAVEGTSHSTSVEEDNWLREIKDWLSEMEREFENLLKRLEDLPPLLPPPELPEWIWEPLPPFEPENLPLPDLENLEPPPPP